MKRIMLWTGAAAGVLAVIGGMLDMRWLLMPSVIVLFVVLALLAWTREETEPASRTADRQVTHERDFGHNTDR